MWVCKSCFEMNENYMIICENCDHMKHGKLFKAKRRVRDSLKIFSPQDPLDQRFQRISIRTGFNSHIPTKIFTTNEATTPPPPITTLTPTNTHLKVIYSVLHRGSTPTVLKPSGGIRIPFPLRSEKEKEKVSKPRGYIRTPLTSEKEKEKEKVIGSGRRKIKRCTRVFFDKWSKKSYKMTSSPRGNVLIINVNKIPGEISRTGTDVDRDNLKHLFKELDFTVHVYNDEDGLSAMEIKNKVKNFAELSDHISADAAVVCIMSHGSNGIIYGTDNKAVQLESEVYALFHNDNCKSLANKPKIFIMQCCRGGKEDEGVSLNQLEKDSSSLIENKKEPTNVKVPILADMLIFNATPEGFVSWRDPYNGSWLISALVEVFVEHAHNCEINQMVSMVNNQVSRMITRVVTEERSYECLQIPKVEHTFRHPFYFFPGINDTKQRQCTAK